MKQKFDMTAQLQAELTRRISQMESEDDYVKNLLNGQKPQGAMGIDIAGERSKDAQIGTGVPLYYGAMDTFIANPSAVGLGIIARMIETDPTVQSAVQLKSLMMLSKIGEYQHDDQEIEDFVRDFLSKMYGPTWKEAMEAMSSKFGYNFSVTEIIWGINKAQQKVPMKLKTYHPTTICFEVDQYGEVTENGIVQFIIQTAQISNPNNRFPQASYGFEVKNPFTTPDDNLMPYRMPFINNYGLVRIPKDKCIHHVHGNLLSFGSPYGKSSIRTAHLAWQLKVYIIKQMGIAAKRQASPFLWGTAPHNINKVEMNMPDGSKQHLSPIDALTEILNQREGDDSIVTGPSDKGYNITPIIQAMDLNQYLSVLLWLDTQIFRAFLLPSLVMTDGSSGSRSLGDKHFEIVDRIAEEEALTFGHAIIDQMVRQAIVNNFGEQDDYGHFAQRPQNLEERERLANLFSTLTTSGYMSSHDKTDGDYVRSTLHLPEQEESFYTVKSPNLDDLDKPVDKFDKPAKEPLDEGEE